MGMTLSLRRADVRSAGGYDVGYDECSHTTHFVTDLGRLDIVRVSDDMVPPADNQSKQHTLSNLPSHHWATLSLRRADMGGVGGYDVEYNECYCTTDFATSPGRLDIVHHTHVAAAT